VGNRANDESDIYSTTVIKTATDNLQTQTQKIAGLTTTIATKAAQINDVVSESLNQLTSAGSFCHIEAQGNPDDSISFSLFHDGKYPVYDVLVQIRDSNVAKRFIEERRKNGETGIGNIDVNAFTGVVFTHEFGTTIGVVPAFFWRF